MTVAATGHTAPSRVLHLDGLRGIAISLVLVSHFVAPLFPSLPGQPSGYVLRANQLAGTDEVLLERIDGGASVTRLTIARELAVGDTLLLRVKGSTLEAWLKRGSTWSLLGSVEDSTYAAAGRVGLGIRGKTGRLDDFGAR